MNYKKNAVSGRILISVILIVCLVLSTAGVYAETEDAVNTEEVREAEQNASPAVQEAELKAASAGTVELNFEEARTGNYTAAPVSIKVYQGAFSDIEAPKIYGNYCIENAEAGDVFTCRIYSEGYYTYIMADSLTEADIAAGRKTVTYTLDKRAGTGYEAKEIYRWNEGAEKMFFSADTLTGVDRNLLDTPSFSTAKAAHQFTSIEEGVSYLQGICENSSRAHLYFVDGNTSYPAVVLTETDLSGADTLTKAISRLSKDGKLKVMYQAQIHGNEPASGEGALAVCRGLSQNGQLLSSMDVVVIPYVNTRGSKNFTRTNGSGVNINRDALQLESAETKRLHKIYNKLMPEIFIDGHEFNMRRNLGKTVSACRIDGADDVRIACLENLNRDKKLFNIERTIVKNTVDRLPEKGFRTFYYPANWDSTTSCNYARMQNSLSILVETNGIGNGKLGMERRVLAQYESVMSVLEQAASKKKTIISSVKTARDNIKQRGKRYGEDKTFVLTHQASETDPMTAKRSVFDFSGNYLVRNQLEASYNRSTAAKERSLPTAYIIPKSADGAYDARDILAANGARYFEIKKGARISVSQYTGSSKNAKKTKRKHVTFTKGAYVFYMDQTAANIIAATMEPDGGDSAEYDGSLVQSGTLRKKNGKYPIYRYTGRNPQKSLAEYKKKEK